MKKRETNLMLIIIVVVFILSIGATVGQQGVESVADPEVDVPYYAERGTYAVGMLERSIEGDALLAVTVWYPAAGGADGEGLTYDYGVKLGDPLGTVAVASFAGQAVSGLTPDHANGPYPLVVLSPGFSVSSQAYAWLGEHLASYGFVVISPDHVEHLDPESQLWRAAVSRPADVLAVFTYVDAAMQEDGELAGLVDGTRVAVAGHSYGGYTALAAAGARIDTAAFEAHCQQAIAEEHEAAWLCEMLLAHVADMAELAGLDTVPDRLWPATSDARVDAVVSLAGDAFFFGPEGLAEITFPLMAISGTADHDSPYEWSTRPAYEHSSGARKVAIALEGAEHMIFTAKCDNVRWFLKWLSGEFCADSSWNRGTAHAVTRHFVTAFLLAELTGDENAAAALAPQAVDLADVRFIAEGFGE